MITFNSSILYRIPEFQMYNYSSSVGHSNVKKSQFKISLIFFFFLLSVNNSKKTGSHNLGYGFSKIPSSFSLSLIEKSSKIHHWLSVICRPNRNGIFLEMVDGSPCMRSCCGPVLFLYSRCGYYKVGEKNNIYCITVLISYKTSS